jgi:cytochrome c-type biogenesis protein CcmH
MPSIVPARHLVWLALTIGACTAAPDPAGELAAHLYAPCCWRQTLADHESPLATELRVEIAGRLASGETSAAIEHSLVERYGERIRARDEAGVVSGVIVAILVSGLAILWLVYRRGRKRHEPATAARQPEDSRFADTLDDELAALPD